MKFTNRAHLPEPLFKAVCNDSYDAGDSFMSVTGLIGPARIRALKRKHAEHLTEDASDRIWSLVGQVGHAILQRCGDASVTEQRLYITRHGRKIGGQIDLIASGIIDYKFCSYHVAKDGVKPEWAWQLNLYRLICLENGIENVDRLQIVAIFRDWSKMAAARSADYPESQVKVLDVPVFKREEVEAYLQQRLYEHSMADTELPECTDEERWAKPERWALMKKGLKRAIKLYPSEEQAVAAQSDPKHFVEHRPGEWTRCEYYCPVAAYCSQFRTYMEAKAA